MFLPSPALPGVGTRRWVSPRRPGGRWCPGPGPPAWGAATCCCCCCCCRRCSYRCCWGYRWCCCRCCWCRCQGLHLAPSSGGVGGDALPLRLGESRLLPSPGRRHFSLLSQRSPARVTVHGKLRPVPPCISSSPAQAGADTPIWPSLPSPVPRLAASGKGLGGERKAQVAAVNFVYRFSLYPSHFGERCFQSGQSQKTLRWYRSNRGKQGVEVRWCPALGHGGLETESLQRTGDEQEGSGVTAS